MSLGAFVCIFGGAFIGMYLRRRLPGHHLDADTKDVVRLGGGFISTIASLVLGLLIASANSTFEAQSGQVKQLIANTILLDNVLALYGPEVGSMRSSLRRSIPIMTDRIWREIVPTLGRKQRSRQAWPGWRSGRRSWRCRRRPKPSALQGHGIERHRRYCKGALSAVREGGLTPHALPCGTGILAHHPFCELQPLLQQQRNRYYRALRVCGFGVCFIFLILELSTPFSGLMQIPSEALRNALAPLHP